MGSEAVVLCGPAFARPGGASGDGGLSLPPVAPRQNGDDGGRGEKFYGGNINFYGGLPVSGIQQCKEAGELIFLNPSGIRFASCCVAMPDCRTCIQKYKCFIKYTCR